MKMLRLFCLFYWMGFVPDSYSQYKPTLIYGPDTGTDISKYYLVQLYGETPYPIQDRQMQVSNLFGPNQDKMLKVDIRQLTYVNQSELAVFQPLMSFKTQKIYPGQIVLKQMNAGQDLYRKVEVKAIYQTATGGAFFLGFDDVNEDETPYFLRAGQTQLEIKDYKYQSLKWGYGDLKEGDTVVYLSAEA